MTEKRKYKKRELTAKQAKFASFYVKSSDASDSYRKSYDAAKMSMESVNRAAHELLKNANVTARIEYLQSKVDEAEIYSIDKVLSGFGQIAFADITDVFDFDTTKNKIMLKGGAKKLSELPREITGCIQSLKQTKDGIEVKLYAKDNALAQIARIKGYFAPDKIITAESSLADLLK